MRDRLPPTWKPWRTASPLDGERPTKADLAGLLLMLIIGINPSPWTAAVNAPFARPGNRFWASLAAAGIIDDVVDASRGLSRGDEHMLAALGIGITNIVSRPTARADQLTRSELHAGSARLVERVHVLRPVAAAILGITALRTAFNAPNATLGLQPPDSVPSWPDRTELWGLPNPSGLNAHETISSLAAKWGPVWG